MSILRASWFLICPLGLEFVLSGQTISFGPPIGLFSSGASRISSMCGTCIVTADFNGDGIIDVVYSGNTFTAFAGVLLGNGDGTFRPGVTFGSDTSGSPAVGDFNGDGRPDIVFLGGFSGGSATLYLGNGDGSFSGPFLVPGCTNFLRWDDGTPNSVSIVTAADLNGDGKHDLVCGPTILLSQGDGSFLQGAQTLDGDVQLTADFDGDGRVDILLMTESGQLAVALGRGDGTFAPPLPVSIELQSSSDELTVQAGDFNADGNVDLAVRNPDGTSIVVLPGVGDGTFGPPITTPAMVGRFTGSGDLNDDGALDLVAGDTVLAGNGDGTFRVPVFLGITTESCDVRNVEDGFNCDYLYETTAVTDLNGDGLPDLVSGYLAFGGSGRRSVSISVMLNDGH